MILPTVYLAAEDLLGLAVGRKLVAEQPNLSIYREENARGSGNLKRKASNYNQMGANGFPVLLLTDLDLDPCPSGKVLAWLGKRPNPRFLFRVCVREVEAWLIADREAMAAFLSIKPNTLPTAPEMLADPKATLIQLAQRSPRKIRTGLTPTGNSTIGPEYNELLCNFIDIYWSIGKAVDRAPSLSRARRRVTELATEVGH